MTRHPDDATPLPTAAAGVQLQSAAYEKLLGALREAIARLAADEPFERLVVPPVISRATIERAGYVASFPQLLGTVHSYTGSAADWRRLAPLIAESGPWHGRQTVSDLVLLPAACYPVYATLTGQDLRHPARFSVEAQCFRQEATAEPGRLRTFRMAELVTAGTPAHCLDWREHWLQRVADWLETLGLKPSIDLADDPFFGGGRRLYQAAQRAQELKFELRVPVADGLVQAIASANIHKDHFGEAFAFTADGAPGHTACTAFGLDRIALALLHTHGSRPVDWPEAISTALNGD
ncbi:aminoacyl-tRNA synthetase [Kitasatospora griseola]|uniref:Aminoacyl-tRNA synthetase n=1 Tax=Kitasatospora griseola TaxID=2064 RepID=A0A0D0Q2T7_KITGR|nr:aminoacyl-tRNA synthetase [Kitasatospora griseola]KIQ65238.1 aminoacyl-tRNA synthetase [Kitasatospora griseola]